MKIHRDSNTVWTASDDKTIRVFDLQKKTCIKTFKGHLGQVQQILIMPEDFEPDEAEMTSESGELVLESNEEESTSRLPAYFFSASLDNTLKVSTSMIMNP